MTTQEQTVRDEIKAIHDSGKRALITYKLPDDYTFRGLATGDALKGVGPQGVWYVCVNGFANPIRLEHVLSCVSVDK